jgi:hypothetical protein
MKILTDRDFVITASPSKDEEDEPEEIPDVTEDPLGRMNDHEEKPEVFDCPSRKWKATMPWCGMEWQISGQIGNGVF